MKTYIQRSYELGTLCARADKALDIPAIQINAETLTGFHWDKQGCGSIFIAGYNTQVLRNLSIPTRATYRAIVKETEKFWRI